MSGGPLARESLLDGLTAHLAASLGIDTNDTEEMNGVAQIASASADYFSSSARGAPPGAGQTLLWAIYSALWEGQVDQAEINEFFAKVRVDPVNMIHAWRDMDQKDKASPVSVVLIPGSLTNADIAAVTASLFRARGD